MLTPIWQLKVPINAVIFDCDGTLSRIEGIDELAKNSGVSDIVQRLTQDAMSKSGMSETVYAERLSLTQPTKEQVAAMGQTYIQQCVPHIAETIHVLHRLKKEIYILSAGLSPAVTLFGKWLQIPEKNIFAVNISFDDNGRYLDFDHSSPLIKKNGKRVTVEKLQAKHPEIALVGDGLSDYEAYDLVTRFIGYGGAFYRENIEKDCDFYLKTLSMAPLLPILLTETEFQQLTHDEQMLFNQGLTFIKKNQVKLPLG